MTDDQTTEITKMVDVLREIAAARQLLVDEIWIKDEQTKKLHQDIIRSLTGVKEGAKHDTSPQRA